MRVHPLADLLPPMSETELDELTTDIAQHGQREPATTYRGADGELTLLDGRHRALACERLGVALRTVEHAGDEASARALVLSLNVHRRHLSPSQRSLVAGALAQRTPGGRQPATLPVASQAEAARAVGVSERTVRDGALLVRAGADELVAAVAAGELSVSKAAAIVRESGRDRQAAAALYLAHRRHSASDSWLTPAWLVERVAACLGEIDGDPAAEPERGIPARWHLTSEDDGLAAESWANPDGSASRIYLNPPYNGGAGQGPGAWTRRAVAEFERGTVARAVLLLPYRPGSHWLRDLSAHPRVELTGRLTFEPGVGNPARERWLRAPEGTRMEAQFTSLLVGVGIDAASLHRHFHDVGVVMQRYEP